MYDNIGGKIKVLAKFFCIIGIIASVAIGLGILALYDFLSFLLVAGVGSLISWISSFCLYGFGQLIENSDKQVELLEKSNKNTKDIVDNTKGDDSII